MTTIAGYPVQLDVEYPDRPLNRLTTALRIFTIIPIAIVLGAVSGGTLSTTVGNDAAQTTTTVVVGAGGILFAAPLLMILFRQKYPRWWFDWMEPRTDALLLKGRAVRSATRRPLPLDG